MSHQMSLFGDMNQRTNQYGYALEDQPIARATDPRPSHVAAEQVRCGLSQTQALFVGTLRAASHPMTSAEIAAAAIPVSEPYATCRRETIRKRASELVKRGWIRIVGERSCSVTGNAASLYEVTR
jgi:hypothetical protein